jgi:hypothetical protein
VRIDLGVDEGDPSQAAADSVKPAVSSPTRISIRERSGTSTTMPRWSARAR